MKNKQPQLNNYSTKNKNKYHTNFKTKKLNNIINKNKVIKK